MRPRYRQLVSLGKHCRPAYQIRRHTRTQKASYFDWLETPHEAILFALQNGLDTLFDRDQLALTQNRLGVKDMRSGILYHHHFLKSSSQETVNAASLNDGFPIQKAKFDFLKRRWYESLSAPATLYVREDTMTPDQVVELHDAMTKHIGHKEFGLLIVVSPEHTLSIDHPSIHVATGEPASKTSGDWQGTDAVWSSLLDQYWQRDELV